MPHNDHHHHHHIPETPYTAVAAAPVNGRCVVPAEYLLLPEAQGLSWKDEFFVSEMKKNPSEDNDGTVAVFDFDYDKMKLFYTQIRAVSQGVAVTVAAFYVGLLSGSVVAAPLLVVAIYLVSLAPCLLQRQVMWEVESNHLAITRDGIRFVQDRRKTCCGFPMCDQGKHSKTVPFDKITDCDITEPAGNQYLCIPRLLSVVHVDTASSGTEGNQHELWISGLQEPYKFKALVWAMKRLRNGNVGGYQAPPPQNPAIASFSLESNDRNLVPPALTHIPSTDSSSSGGVKSLLRSIRDELRRNNYLLQTIKGPETTKEATTPTPNVGTLV